MALLPKGGKFIIKCISSSDMLIVDDSYADHELFIRTESEGIEQNVLFDKETAAQLRDALTEWLEGCNHG